jgi:hypothetical protein
MSERLVTVSTFNDPIAAAMAKNFLESEGIPAVLMDETAVATDWLLSNAIGGIKLQVALLHLERAEHLLERLTPSGQEEADELPSSAIATEEKARAIQACHQEIAEEKRAAEVDATPCNQLADRLLRTAVLGLLLWPLEFYALVLLLSAFSERQEISADRQWKIWLSAAIILPALAGFTLCFPVFCFPLPRL